MRRHGPARAYIAWDSKGSGVMHAAQIDDAVTGHYANRFLTEAVPTSSFQEVGMQAREAMRRGCPGGRRRRSLRNAREEGRGPRKRAPAGEDRHRVLTPAG